MFSVENIGETQIDRMGKNRVYKSMNVCSIYCRFPIVMLYVVNIWFGSAGCALFHIPYWQISDRPASFPGGWRPKKYIKRDVHTFFAVVKGTQA